MNRAVLAILIALLPLGCLPGSQTASAGPSENAPADEVFMQLLRAIEERRVDRFTAAVDPVSDPPRDRLYEDFQTFTATADDIEYNVNVERRMSEGFNTIYVFTWQRKYRDKDTGQLVNTPGRSEWTLSRATGRFLLVQATGARLF